MEDKIKWLSLDNLLAVKTEQPNESKNRTVVRVKTSIWKSGRGLHIKRDVIYLKRSSQGMNFLEEELDSVGAEEAFYNIANITSVEDGIYELIPTNFHRDFETGIVDEVLWSLVPSLNLKISSERGEVEG